MEYLIVSLFLTITLMLAYLIRQNRLCRKQRDQITKKYYGLKLQQDSYLNTVVEKAYDNVKHWVAQKTLISGNLIELENLFVINFGAIDKMANTRSLVSLPANENKVIAIDRNRTNPVYLSHENPLLGVKEITDRLRGIIWDYAPDHKKHFSGTVQTLNDFSDLMELSVLGYSEKNNCNLLYRKQFQHVNAEHFMFYNQEFISRWIVFLSMFSRRNKSKFNSPPAWELSVGKAKRNNYCHIRSSFVVYATDLIPENLDEHYERYFYSGEMSDCLQNLDQCLLEALKMASAFSVLVRSEVNRVFGTTTLTIERDCFLSPGREGFERMFDLRKKYQAAEVNYIAGDNSSAEENHLIEALDEKGVSFQTIPVSDWCASLVSRTALVVIGSDIGNTLQKKLAQEALRSAYSKMRVCVICQDRAETEKIEKIVDPGIIYIDSPLVKENLDGLF